MLFRKGHGAELLAENGRLEELNTKTMKWWKEISLATRLEGDGRTQERAFDQYRDWNGIFR